MKITLYSEYASSTSPIALSAINPVLRSFSSHSLKNSYIVVAKFKVYYHGSSFITIYF